MRKKPRLPSRLECVTFLVVAVAVMFCMLPDLSWTLALNQRAEHLGATMPLLVLLCIAAAMTFRLGYSYAEIHQAVMHGIGLALPAVLILIVVGGLIGTWLAAGTISTLIYLGLKLLSPSYFLPATLLICSVVSLSSGSSWTTAATVGIALMGVGTTLGVSPAMTAGAIISGAYFGDKLSPLSDTTNLAPGIAGADLFGHISAMLQTTIPSFAVAFVAFSALALTFDAPELASVGKIETMQQILRHQQRVSMWLLVPPGLVLVLAMRRAPALPALLLSSVVAMVLAVVVQREGVGEVFLNFLQGFEMRSGDESIDDLLSGGGMESMLYTVMLIMTATGLGGVLERGRYLEVMMSVIRQRVRSPGGLVVATLGVSASTNVLLSDQYLSVVLPGRLFREAYRRFDLSPRMLSRSLEDAGTLTSPLVPWNSCGAFMAGTLGVATVQYLPFCFFNIVNPILAATFARLGWCLLRRDERDLDPLAGAEA
jgi:NhaC family Na+:H+ antiporter